MAWHGLPRRPRDARSPQGLLGRAVSPLPSWSPPAPQRVSTVAANPARPRLWSKLRQQVAAGRVRASGTEVAESPASAQHQGTRPRERERVGRRTHLGSFPRLLRRVAVVEREPAPLTSVLRRFPPPFDFGVDVGPFPAAGTIRRFMRRASGLVKTRSRSTAPQADLQRKQLLAAAAELAKETALKEAERHIKVRHPTPRSWLRSLAPRLFRPGGLVFLCPDLDPGRRQAGWSGYWSAAPK